MPWEKSFEEREVLERAMRAFWARGYEATSMSDLVEATGIQRGSIYAAFESKRALFLRVLRQYDETYRADYLAETARRYAPKDAIIETFKGASRNTGRSGTPAGCLLVNSALELSPHDPEIRDFIDGCLREVEDFFCSCIKAAQREGTIVQSLAPRPTAQALLGLFLGLRVLTRGKPRKASLEAIIEQARAMLG